MRLAELPRVIDPIVLGSGLLALDVLVQEPAKTPVRCAAGGTCGNVLSILSYLGWTAYPAAKLGQNDAAQVVIDDLESFGVCTDFITCTREARTPVIVQVNDIGGRDHHFSFRCPHCGARLPRFSPIDGGLGRRIHVETIRPKVFFFDRAEPAIVRLAMRCAEIGALVIFEPSMVKQTEVSRRALRVADVIKYSTERLGLADFAKDDDPQKALLIRTVGEKGLYLRMPGSTRWSHLPVVSANSFVDSAGAGDWCTAGFVFSLFEQMGTDAMHASKSAIVEAIRFGQTLAAANCEFEGARGLMYATPANELRQSITRKRLTQTSRTSVRASPVSSSLATFDRCPACT